MRDRFRQWLHQETVAPRWVAFVWFARDLFLVIGAATVIILWWQAATRDEEADRNARIQSCSSVYAATYSAWDSEGNRLFGELIAAAVADEIPEAIVTDYQTATSNTAEMARLRIGLGRYAAQSVIDGNEFVCPTLPDRLMVEAIDPP